MSLEMLKAILKGKSTVIYLDDLCKWLETHALKVPYIITDPGDAITAEAWKELLTEWMEKRNASPQ